MIKDKIEEIQKYFKDKILNQDFEFNSKDFSLNEITLIIDKYYKFEFHFDFQEKRAYQISWYFRDNFLKLETSKEQEEKIYKIFQSEIDWFLEKEKAKKLAEYEKLKKELNL